MPPSQFAKDGELMPHDQTPLPISPDAIAAATHAAAPARRPLPLFRELPPQASNDIDLLLDVELDVKIELGRTRMRIEEVLKLADGAVIELNRLAGDPVDVFVSDRLVARGEVVVLNDNFAVRLTEIVSPIRQ